MNNKKKKNIGKSMKNNNRIGEPAMFMYVLAAVSIMFVAGVSVGNLPITGFDVLPDTTPPVLSNLSPETESYVAGGSLDIFVSASDEDMNESSVRLYIKSSDSLLWDDHIMICSFMGDGGCERYVKTLALNIVGSDTTEQFYFSASDNTGNTGYLGSAEEPMTFIVDINSPEIDFVIPSNNTHTCNGCSMELDVSDPSSGVDNSSVAYSFDNQTWVSIALTDSGYVTTLPMSGFSDGESAIIYAMASDMIGNDGYEWVNVTVDNTDPSVDIISPSNNQTLVGVSLISANITDAHSGIDRQKVGFSVGSYGSSMDCLYRDGVQMCTRYFDTSSISDGIYVLDVYAYDNAGNTANQSIPIVVYNELISVQISDPSNGAYISGNTLVNATVYRAEGKVSKVTAGFSGTDYSEDTEMSCDQDYTCACEWESSILPEGIYSIFVNVENTAGIAVNSSASVTIDRTAPTIQIDSPAADTVNGTIYPKIVINDVYGVDPSTVRFNISTMSETMNCVQYVQGKRYVCTGTLNTTLLGEGSRTIYFQASDLAGNKVTASKSVRIDNIEGVESTPDSTTTTTTTSPPLSTTSTTNGVPEVHVSTDVVEQIVISLGSAGEFIADRFSEWPVQALAIAIIITIAVIAVFRNSQIVKFFRGNGSEEPADQESVKS